MANWPMNFVAAELHERLVVQRAARDVVEAVEAGDAAGAA
jgi:hypothetical protein